MVIWSKYYLTELLIQNLWQSLRTRIKSLLLPFLFLLCELSVSFDIFFWTFFWLFYWFVCVLWVFFFVYLICRNSLYILHIKPLSTVCTVNIFSPVQGVLFSDCSLLLLLLKGFKNWMLSNLTIISIVVCFLRHLPLSWYHRDILLYILMSIHFIPLILLEFISVYSMR